MNSEHVESVTSNGTLLALIVRDGFEPETTTFLTQDHLSFQLGFIRYPSGGEVQRHHHLPISRDVPGTSEAVLVKRGICEVDVYDHGLELIATRRLNQGDLVLLFEGGHGFRVVEDALLMEIKQGPYPGPTEKERF